MVRGIVDIGSWDELGPSGAGLNSGTTSSVCTNPFQTLPMSLFSIDLLYPESTPLGATHLQSGSSHQFSTPADAPALPESTRNRPPECLQDGEYRLRPSYPRSAVNAQTITPVTGLFTR
jgi:hypothetical protein